MLPSVKRINNEVQQLEKLQSEDAKWHFHKVDVDALTLEASVHGYRVEFDLGKHYPFKAPYIYVKYTVNEKGVSTQKRMDLKQYVIGQLKRDFGEDYYKTKTCDLLVQLYDFLIPKWTPAIRIYDILKKLVVLWDTQAAEHS